MLDERQHEAGGWLARCFRWAVHQPSMTTYYGERVGGGAGAAPMLDGRNTLWRVLLASGLAASTAKGAAGRNAAAGLVLTPRGNVAINVCGMEEWAGGTRNLVKLRSAFDALADHLRVGQGTGASVQTSACHETKIIISLKNRLII